MKIKSYSVHLSCFIMFYVWFQVINIYYFVQLFILFLRDRIWKESLWGSLWWCLFPISCVSGEGGGLGGDVQKKEKKKTRNFSFVPTRQTELLFVILEFVVKNSVHYWYYINNAKLYPICCWRIAEVNSYASLLAAAMVPSPLYKLFCVSRSMSSS